MQFLFYLNPKFQASSHLLGLYSPVCFSQRGSYVLCFFSISNDTTKAIGNWARWRNSSHNSSGRLSSRSLRGQNPRSSRPSSSRFRSVRKTSSQNAKTGKKCSPNSIEHCRRTSISKRRYGICFSTPTCPFIVLGKISNLGRLIATVTEMHEHN